MAESRVGSTEPEGRNAARGGARPPWDVAAALAALERALSEVVEGGAPGVVGVRLDAGWQEELPLSVLLRGPEDLTPLEREALAHCRGRVLDVGAAAGAHALALQAAGRRVTALDALPSAVRLMERRGVEDARLADAWTFEPGAGERWDTVLVLMNGTTLAGTRRLLPRFLGRLASWLAPGGRVLIDSTDPRAFSDEVDPESAGGGAGELQYQLEYRGERGPPFPQLYVDEGVLAGAARSAGLRCRVVHREGDGRWLARLEAARPGPGDG